MALNPYAPPEEETEEQDLESGEDKLQRSTAPVAFFVLAWLVLFALFVLADPKAILLGIPLVVSLVWYVTAKLVK